MDKDRFYMPDSWYEPPEERTYQESEPAEVCGNCGLTEDMHPTEDCTEWVPIHDGDGWDGQQDDPDDPYVRSEKKAEMRGDI